jgi:hypothetical protein
MADPCIADTDCIALTGEGTLAQPLQADIVLDPDPDQALECRVTGLWSGKCAISTEDCNGIVTYPGDGHWASLIEKRNAGATVAGGSDFVALPDIPELLYQSGSLTMTLDTCVDAMVFYRILFGTVYLDGISGGARIELEDQGRTQNGVWNTFGFEVVDNSTSFSFLRYASWPSVDASTMGVEVEGGATFEIGFQRFAYVTDPFNFGYTSASVEFEATEIDVLLLAIS